MRHEIQATFGTKDGLRTIRRELALVDPEFAMLLPAGMRIQRLERPAV